MREEVIEKLEELREVATWVEGQRNCDSSDPGDPVFWAGVLRGAVGVLGVLLVVAVVRWAWRRATKPAGEAATSAAASARKGVKTGKIFPYNSPK